MNTARESVGILGVGSYLPDEVRTNDWWPRSIVEKWEQKAVESGIRPTADARKSVPSGGDLVLDAIKEYGSDPFAGARERRVMPENMLPSDMETEAAKRAMTRAGVSAKDVDFVISASAVPDMLNVPNACAVHSNLGLGSRCFSTAIESVCNGFLHQISLAEQMIAGGKATVGLLVQSSAWGSRMMPIEQPYSAWFGDGATAVVVGVVDDGAGVLGTSHRTDGSLRNALHTGVLGKKWYEDGRSVWHHGDRRAAFEMLVRIPECAVQVFDDALASAGLTQDDVSFLATHQATSWFRKVVQEHGHFAKARSVDTFSWAGSLVASNIPLVLDVASREGLLKRGDVLAMHSGGSGITYSAVVARWTA